VVHARHRRQTDGFAIALAKRDYVTFGKKTNDPKVFRLDIVNDLGIS